MKRRLLGTFLSFLVTHCVWAQTPYKQPPEIIAAAMNAPPPPSVQISPRGDAMAMVEYNAHPSIALLAEPIAKLAGVRFNPAATSSQRLIEYTGISVRWPASGRTIKVDLPTGSKIGIPVWSYDGASLAFARYQGSGVELWIADATTGKSRMIPSVRLNDVLRTAITWMSDNAHLLVSTVPHGRGPEPERPRVPDGPVIDETSGKFSQMRTFQDLLNNPYDEDLFTYHATGQLAVVDARSGKATPIGAPAIYLDADFSPDGKFLLVQRLHRPYSYRVPYFYFARTTEVLDRSGTPVHVVADLPISDEIPRYGVATGPRDVSWQPLKPAQLIWTEALDGGDPTAKVDHRDRIMTVGSPFDAEPREILKVQHRFAGLQWLPAADQAFMTEYDRDRRWLTTRLLDLNNPEQGKVVFDLSYNDDYANPGTLVHAVGPDGERLIVQDGDWVYLSGKGASEQGERPFLDRMNLKTLQKERLHQSSDSSLDRFIAFAGGARNVIITRYESSAEPPNYYAVDLSTGSRKALTELSDPAPVMRTLQKRLVKYSRADGVALSGTLYLPPDYTEGTRLPLIVWAYPLEYSDAGTAGQVRGSPNAFTRLWGYSPIYLALAGYAVLNDAAMPVVGSPETMNDTFIEQVVGSAKGAIDYLDSAGIIDRNRVAVGGHSYGAFMTANLLAHSDLFAAGFALSGAYNRTLTPFGFQGERRSFWEAQDVYMKISPFASANKINEPLLLVHGEADNNPGTFTVQSERLFQAIKGNGGTAKLVLLPYESHGYVARESVLHVMAELVEWANKFVKSRQAAN